MSAHWYARIPLAGWIVAYFVVTTALAWIWIAVVADDTDTQPVAESKTTVQAPATTETTDVNARRLDGVIVAPGDENPYPVAIMIDNVEAAWPHSGLEAASVFYETLVEGSATRIMAIFGGGTVSKIGPVRSARPYFVDWALEYDAFYGHVGGSPESLAAIDGLGVKDFSQFANGQYYWRSTDRSAPHNVYTSSELIIRALRDKGYDSLTPSYDMWMYDDDLPIEERPTEDETITVKFANTLSRTRSFTYDRASNSYLRFQAGLPHIDVETGNQLRAKNVAVVIIPPIVDIGEKGRLTLDMHGEGQLFFFSDGNKIEGTWSKPDATTRIFFRDADGNLIAQNRGTTWVEIIPVDHDVLYETSTSGS